MCLSLKLTEEVIYHHLLLNILKILDSMHYPKKIIFLFRKTCWIYQVEVKKVMIWYESWGNLPLYKEKLQFCKWNFMAARWSHQSFYIDFRILFSVKKTKGKKKSQLTFGECWFHLHFQEDKNVAHLTHVSEMEKKIENLLRITTILKDVI